MISIVKIIILSYINKYKDISIEQISKVIVEPISFIADEIVVLFNEGYIYKTELGYDVTEKTNNLNIDLWDLFASDNFKDSFDYSYNSSITRNGFGYPQINDVKILKELLCVNNLRTCFYHDFYLSKSNKRDSRKISAPSKKLKLRQKWILNNILYNYNICESVHGFVKGKSIYTNAVTHINQSEIGCVDIKDFFPSIKYESVLSVFLDMGYNNDVSDFLAKICTYKNCLPQGAPTSPMLSNIILAPLDIYMTNYARKNNLKYSRYADDFTLSGNKDISQHIDFMINKICEMGFQINDDKTRIMKGKYRKIVTGLIVKETVKIPQKFKRTLRQEIYYCKKFGITQHLYNSGRSSAVHFKEYLYGKAYYISMVEPEVGKKFLEQLDEIFIIHSY